MSIESPESSEQKPEPKRRIYFAKRITPNLHPSELLPVKPGHSAEDVKKLYVEKEVEYPGYVQTGMWTMRPVQEGGDLAKSTLPEDLQPSHIWEMVKTKIEQSDVVVSIVNDLSYGTILESGYAAGLGRVALYVLPDKNLGKVKEDDLWFAFQASLATKHLWKQEDFDAIPAFKEFGIQNAAEYEELISIIVPKFLSK